MHPWSALSQVGALRLGVGCLSPVAMGVVFHQVAGQLRLLSWLMLRVLRMRAEGGKSFEAHFQDWHNEPLL